jgi:hypothetical protein
VLRELGLADAVLRRVDATVTEKAAIDRVVEIEALSVEGTTVHETTETIQAGQEAVATTVQTIREMIVETTGGLHVSSHQNRSYHSQKPCKKARSHCDHSLI